jgi:hypothetical protein
LKNRGAGVLIAEGFALLFFVQTAGMLNGFGLVF